MGCCTSTNKENDNKNRDMLEKKPPLKQSIDKIPETNPKVHDLSSKNKVPQVDKPYLNSYQVTDDKITS